VHGAAKETALVHAAGGAVVEQQDRSTRRSALLDLQFPTVDEADPPGLHAVVVGPADLISVDR